MLEKYHDRLISLTPKQSQLYGRLGNETENFTTMIHDDVKTSPALKPEFVSDAEWQKDLDARKAIYPRATRLFSIAQRFVDTARLLGYDIYNTSLSVYNNVKFLASRNQAGAKTYYEKWSVQYPGGKRTGLKASGGNG